MAGSSLSTERGSIVIEATPEGPMRPMQAAKLTPEGIQLNGGEPQGYDKVRAALQSYENTTGGNAPAAVAPAPQGLLRPVTAPEFTGAQSPPGTPAAPAHQPAAGAAGAYDPNTLIPVVQGTTTVMKPLSEVVGGYMRQQDYTAKTQGIADRERQLADEQARLGRYGSYAAQMERDPVGMANTLLSMYGHQPPAGVAPQAPQQADPDDSLYGGYNPNTNPPTGQPVAAQRPDPIQQQILARLDQLDTDRRHEQGQRVAAQQIAEFRSDPELTAIGADGQAALAHMNTRGFPSITSAARDLYLDDIARHRAMSWNDQQAHQAATQSQVASSAGLSAPASGHPASGIGVAPNGEFTGMQEFMMQAIRDGGGLAAPQGAGGGVIT